MTELVLASRRSCRRKAYPEELKAFALTLHFYSAKAHDFIRQTFDMALPHPTLIRSWNAKINEILASRSVLLLRCRHR